MTPSPLQSYSPPAAPSPRNPPRVRLMGMPLDPVTQAQVIRHVLDALAEGRGGWVITPNLDQLRLYHERADLRPMYEFADLVLADGMPLIWAGGLQGTRLPQRVAGSELIYSLTDAAARAGRSVFLLGGNPGAAADAARVLTQRYPGLRVAGTHCPPFGFEKDAGQMQAIRAALDIAGPPDIVYVGLGFPKQERLIETLRPSFARAWFLGIGVSFSFVSGEIRQAPRWMRRTGVEWIHRMAQEPGRLFRRYVIHDLPFAARLFFSSAAKRCKGGEQS
ncbi:MAG TPA: WecB/TagA/CpsF family glycosyltransferase [Tepidisphaeraceae bacterium]